MSVTGDSLIYEEALEDDTELFICEHCGAEVSEEAATLFENEMLCDTCLDEQTFICFECGNRHWRDEANDYCGNEICDRCYDYNFTCCEECGRTIRNDDANYIDDYEDMPYCNDCFQDKNKIIHGYDYKPEPLFYGSGLFYGVKLEIDEGGEDRGNAEKLLDIANQYEDHIYIKHDGSLINGMEIVTHPMSLHYHTKVMSWDKLLAKALDMGYYSHQCNTCGLHIHVGRNELGESIQEQENTIGRILYFIEKFWDKLIIFSRRTEVQLIKWAKRYGLLDSPKNTLEEANKNKGGRYVCLNLQNYHTIEFRLFRGTLKLSTFLATLQMVDEICTVAKKLDDDEFQGLCWVDFINGVNTDVKPELMAYLKDRKLLNGGN